MVLCIDRHEIMIPTFSMQCSINGLSKLIICMYVYVQSMHAAHSRLMGIFYIQVLKDF
jgi:hypothetical protein